LRKNLFCCCLITLLIYTIGCTNRPQETGDQEVVFQLSTIDALLAGDYDGAFTCGEVLQHGNFGLGTFNGLDGEMIVLNGKVFQLRSDGKVYPVADSTLTPFAMVTHFEADTVFTLAGPLSYEELSARIDSLIPTQNIFYAIRIEGEFAYLKARSVPRQSKPYRPMVEVVQTQPTFEFRQETGTLLGFRTPPFMKGLNVPGYHLHFLTSDQTSGGHVLAGTLGRITVALDYTSAFHMVLPAAGAFHRIDLSQDKQAELEQVEK
jgi:acetolactate decarboxylase